MDLDDMSLKEILDQMLHEAYEEQEDKTQVFKVELFISKEFEEEALGLRKEYMKTNESPYIFDYDDLSHRISLYYIPAMRKLFYFRKIINEYPEREVKYQWYLVIQSKFWGRKNIPADR